MTWSNKVSVRVASYPTVPDAHRLARIDNDVLSLPAGIKRPNVQAGDIIGKRSSRRSGRSA